MCVCFYIIWLMFNINKNIYLNNNNNNKKKITLRRCLYRPNLHTLMPSMENYYLPNIVYRGTFSTKNHKNLTYC